MKIHLEQVGKRFDQEWIVRNFSFSFMEGACYGIAGRNGSGKSTLLRLLSGHLTPTRGQIQFSRRDKQLSVDQLYPLLSYVAPYIELIEELTLTELLRLHFRFKSLRPGLVLEELPQVLELEQAANRSLRNFSSGMKQRVNLGLALWSDTPLVLLDEPTITLDKVAINWFQCQLKDHLADRLVVIASNEPADLDQCNVIISTEDFR